MPDTYGARETTVRVVPDRVVATLDRVLDREAETFGDLLLAGGREQVDFIEILPFPDQDDEDHLGRARAGRRLPLNWRFLVSGTAVGFVAVVTLILAVVFLAGMASAMDYTMYRDAARHWLETGRFYDYTVQCGLPGGPFETCPVLYPPPVLVLLVPFTVLPAFLWWAIPVGVTAWCVASMRPARWTWPIMAACYCFPFGAVRMILCGNPGMWIVAFVALACRYGWAGPLVLLKPTLAPFALIGARSRGWWLAAVIVAIVSLAMIPLWFDYASLLAHPPISLPWTYSLPQVVPCLLPVAAWAGRSKGAQPRGDAGSLFDALHDAWRMPDYVGGAWRELRVRNET